MSFIVQIHKLLLQTFKLKISQMADINSGPFQGLNKNSPCSTRACKEDIVPREDLSAQNFTINYRATKRNSNFLGKASSTFGKKILCYPDK